MMWILEAWGALINSLGGPDIFLKIVLSSALVIWILRSKGVHLGYEKKVFSLLGLSALILSIFYMGWIYSVSWPAAQSWIQPASAYDGFQWALFHLNLTHLGSLATYAILFFAVWFKTEKPVYALILTLGCITVMEFCCIPQHLFMYGLILPWQSAYYIHFAFMAMPFAASVQLKKLEFPRRFWIFLAVGLFLLFISGLLSIQYDFLTWSWSSHSFVLKQVLSTGPGVTAFHLMQRIHKAFFALAFYFVRLKS